jgi:hypothetical protein
MGELKVSSYPILRIEGGGVVSLLRNLPGGNGLTFSLRVAVRATSELSAELQKLPSAA